MPHPIRNALLLIDMQHGLYHAPDAPWQREALLANVQLLVRQARAAGAPVLAARHTGPAGSPIAAGSAAWQLLPELGLDPAHDYLFDKTRPDCFAGTGLKDVAAGARHRPAGTGGHENPVLRGYHLPCGQRTRAAMRAGGRCP